MKTKLTLAELYLQDRGGSLTHFYHQLTKGYRPGQAFFNALSEKDKERLRGTTYDPFYETANFAVVLERTITWLLDTEDGEAQSRKPFEGIRWGEDAARDCQELRKLESWGLYKEGHHDQNCPLEHDISR